MKSNSNVVLIFAGVVLSVLFAGCGDVLSLTPEETPDTGRGTVIVTVAGMGERTIFPETPVFSKYEFTFEPLDGQDGHPDVTVDDGTASTTVQLASGNWKITAKGYVTISGIDDINDDDYRAAQGEANVTVGTTIRTQSISIDIKGGVQDGEKGIVEWDITLPDDAQSANMKILKLDDGTEVQSVNLMDTPGGTRAIDAGYYLLSLSLDNKQSKTEVLHIYGGMTSSIERFHYNVPSFGNVGDLADWLDKAPDNTVDNPYEIVLYNLDIETDFEQNNDPLYKLYNSLKGKYVNLDLSECEGKLISNSAYVPSLDNRDRIVSIILPAGVTSIGNYAFYECTNLALTELPAGLTSIGRNVFKKCTSLALKELPAGVTSIDNDAFYGCTSLALTKLPSGLTSISSGVFDGCTSLALTALPSGLASIDRDAFRNCTSLALTALPAGLTSIGYQTFYGCTSLALTTALPSGITSIDSFAFYGCTSPALTKLELPAGLTSIDSSAFYGCTSLALVICRAVTPPALGSNVFGLTHSSLQIKVPVGNVEAYKAASGWSEYAISAIE